MSRIPSVSFAFPSLRPPPSNCYSTCACLQPNDGMRASYHGVHMAACHACHDWPRARAQSKQSVGEERGRQTDTPMRLPPLPSSYCFLPLSSSSVSNNIYLTRPAAKADWLWKKGFLCGNGGVLGSSTLELSASPKEHGRRDMTEMC